MFLIKIIKQKKARDKKSLLFFLVRNGKSLKYLGHFILRKDNRISLLDCNFSFFLRLLLRTNIKITPRIFRILARVLLSSTNV